MKCTVNDDVEDYTKKNRKWVTLHNPPMYLNKQFPSPVMSFNLSPNLCNVLSKSFESPLNSHPDKLIFPRFLRRDCFPISVYSTLAIKILFQIGKHKIQRLYLLNQAQTNVFRSPNLCLMTDDWEDESSFWTVAASLSWHSAEICQVWIGGEVYYVAKILSYILLAEA